MRAPLREEGECALPKRAGMLKMLARAGFTGAFLLGAGALLRLYVDRGVILWLHIALGLIFLISAWLLSNQPSPRRRLVQAGAALSTVGALVAVGRFLFWPGVSPWWHVVLMLLAIAGVELGAARRGS